MTKDRATEQAMDQRTTGDRPPRDEAATMAAMHRWLEAVSDELGVERAVLDAAPGLLRLIAHVAHGPSRPGAPLTAFLVGLAAGRAGGSDPAPEVERRIERVERLLESWPPPEAG